MSHISSVLSLQGRSRRNAQRQLAVIRLARAQEAEAARAVAHQRASEAPPVTADRVRQSDLRGVGIYAGKALQTSASDSELIFQRP